MNPLDALNVYQRYVVEEFAESYREREMPRRELLRRVMLVTGSVPLTASVLLALGCGDSDDEPTVAEATAGPTEAPATPPPPSGPGVTVQPGDPAIQVQEVSYKGEASDIKAYLARPATGTSFPALVIIHENRGLNEHTRDIARRYAKEGFVGLAVDLISRRGGTGTDAAQNTGNLTGANGPKPEELVADLVSSVEYLKTLPYVKANALGVTGFCFGGGYVFELAVASKDIKAAVPYYGTAMRVLDRLGETQAAILAIYGGNDRRITGESPQVEERLKAGGKTYEIKIYDGANHAFFNDTGGSYNEAAARDAWTNTLAWLRKYLTG